MVAYVGAVALPAKAVYTALIWFTVCAVDRVGTEAW